MKKLILVLFVLAGLVFSQGAPATLSATPASWTWVKTEALLTDTIDVGDSLVLIAKRGMAKGYQTVISRGAVTGGVGDSLQYIVYFDRYNVSGNTVVERTIIDTIGAGVTVGTSASNGEMIVLPSIGGIYRVMLKPGALNSTTAGDKRVIANVEIWQRKL